jgi:type IV pilus assembly protein PilC
VVPSFIEILEDFHVELPIMTKILISVSDFFKAYWMYIIGGGIAFVAVIMNMYRSKSGQKVVDGFIVTMPVIGKVINKVITARFSRTLATLLGSGVLILPALEILKKIIGNSVLQEKFSDVIMKVNKGKGLAQPMIEMDYFEPMVISMVKIGEESGALDSTLNKCADFYEKEVEVSLQQLTGMIEPVVMSGVAVIVGFIVLSILTPMLKIYENFNAG